MHGARRNDLEHDAATADQIRRARKYLNRRHATRERARELRVLRPHRVLDPDIRRHRIRGFVDVVGLRALILRRRTAADVRVRVDDAGRDDTCPYRR